MQRAGRDREHDRERPHEKRPLVHFRRHERAEAGVRVQPPREQAGDEQLRRLRRQRCEPLHEQKRVEAEFLTRVDERLRERLRRGQDHAGGGEEHHDDDGAPSCRGEVADQAGRSDQVRLLGTAASNKASVRFRGSVSE